MKKLNYEEKLEAEFTPYTAVMQYDQIEEVLWKKEIRIFDLAIGTSINFAYFILLVAY
jgi:hypothetical protein